MPYMKNFLFTSFDKNSGMSVYLYVELSRAFNASDTFVMTKQG